MKRAFVTFVFLLAGIISYGQITQVHQSGQIINHNDRIDDDIFTKEDSVSVEILDADFNQIASIDIQKQGWDSDARLVSKKIFDSDSDYEAFVTYQKYDSLGGNFEAKIISETGTQKNLGSYYYGSLANVDGNTFLILQSQNNTSKVYKVPGDGYAPKDTTSTGIIGNEKARKSAIKTYPNPAAQSATIQLNRQSKSDQIEIHNASGRLINTKQLQPGQEKATLDLRNYPPGIYQLKHGNQSGTIVVQ